MKIRVMLFLPLFLLSCGKMMTMSEPLTRIEGTSYQFEEAQTVLGERIEIPYTIENLKKALELLPPETKAAISESDFNPTHYYVRFSPKNMMELDILRNLSPRVIFSEVPLDREVKTGGIYYHDPSLPDDVPTYQYSTISIKRWEDLDTLSVKHEILLKAFMPDYNDNLETKNTPKDYTLSPELEELLKMAYKITGHEFEGASVTKGGSWYPSGYIFSYDNIAGSVPIPNVRVRGTHFLTIKETLTDFNGYFILDSFNNSVTLKVIWESPDWDIRYGLIGQATYDGPTLNGMMWILNIPSTQIGSSHMAAMQRAAHKVFFGYNDGLSKPNYSRKFKMSYMESTLDNGATTGYFTAVTVGGTGPDIQIAGYDTTGARDVSHIFSSTCHEMGHAVHYSNNSLYNSSSDQLKESWARFHQYYITLNEYNDLGYASSLFSYDYSGTMIPDNQYNFQTQATGKHTPLFIDLYDDYNQHSYYNDPALPNDEIAFFPPLQIESLAFSNTSILGVGTALQTYASTHPGNVYNITYQTILDLIAPYN